MTFDSNVVQQCRKLASVSKTWEKLMEDYVPDLYAVTNYIYKSNWILSKFRNFLKKLNLTKNSFIQDNTLMRITFLKDLRLSFNSVITSSCLQTLTNLTN